METKRMKQLARFIVSLSATLFIGLGLAQNALDGLRHGDSLSGLSAIGLMPFFSIALFFTVKTIKPLLKVSR